MSRLKTLIYISMLLYIGLGYYSEIVNIEIDTITLRANSSPRIPEATQHNYYEIEILTTAYSEYDSCHTGSDCLMANGEKAHIGAVACNFLPFNTKMEIDGVIYIVKDRHSKRLEDRLDIWFGFGEDAHERAIQYGKQIKTVKIYK